MIDVIAVNGFAVVNVVGVRIDIVAVYVAVIVIVDYGII